MIEFCQSKILFADNRSHVQCMVTEFLQSHGFDLGGLSPVRYSDEMFPTRGLVIFPFGSFEIHYVQDIDDARKAIQKHNYEKCFISNPISGGTEDVWGKSAYSYRRGFTADIVKSFLLEDSPRIFYTSKYEKSQLRDIVATFIDPELKFDGQQEKAQDQVDGYIASNRLSHVSLHYDANLLNELLANELRLKTKINAKCGSRIVILTL